MKTKRYFLNAKNNRKAKVFLVFLLLSTLFWFFSALSETYSYITTYKVTYTDLPNDLLFQSNQKQLVKAQVKTTGFRVLSHKLKIKNIQIPVSDFEKKGKYNYYYLPNKEIVFLQKQFNNENLVRFASDSLWLDLGVMKTKKVPVVSKVELSFKSGYKLTQKLHIIPDSISVKGPEKHLDSICFFYTKEVKIAEIQQDFNTSISLDLTAIDLDVLSVNTNTVELVGTVAKFTEEQIELPINVLGLSKDTKYRFSHEKVILKYLVSFKNYKKITAKSFEVSCQYPLDTFKTKKASLFLSKKPDFISTYSISPQQVSLLQVVGG